MFYSYDDYSSMISGCIIAGLRYSTEERGRLDILGDGSRSAF